MHPQGDDGRSPRDASLQPPLPPGELPDEVLLLPHPLVAAAPLRRRGLWRENRRLRPRQDGGGVVGALPWPHHLARRPPIAPQARPRHEAHDGGAERHGRGFWC